MNLVWLAMNFFTTEMTVDTSKSKKEVISAIKANTETEKSSSQYTPLKTIGKNFVGTVDKSSFSIKESYYSKYDTKPSITGTVDGKNHGASVYIRISMSKYLILANLGAVLLFLTFLYSFVNELITTKTTEEDTLFFLLFFVVIIIGYIIYNKAKMKNLKRDLRRIIQGPEFREYH